MYRRVMQKINVSNFGNIRRKESSFAYFRQCSTSFKIWHQFLTTAPTRIRTVSVHSLSIYVEPRRKRVECVKVKIKKHQVTRLINNAVRISRSRDGRDGVASIFFLKTAMDFINHFLGSNFVKHAKQNYAKALGWNWFTVTTFILLCSIILVQFILKIKRESDCDLWYIWPSIGTLCL